MPKKGDIIINPISGDRYEFEETARDTNGERISMIAHIHTIGPLVPNHVHIYQEETYEVLDGMLTICVEDRIIKLTQGGGPIILPKNIPHNHFNNETDPVVYRHTVSPALDFDYLMETLVGLAADGKTKNGKYGLIQDLVTLRYIDSKSFLADVPRGLQKVLMHTVAPVARHLGGYRAVYKKYSGIEK